MEGVSEKGTPDKGKAGCTGLEAKREYGDMEQCSANQMKGFLRKKVTKEIMIKMSLG